MIGEAIRAGLKREGFTVDWVHDARAAQGVLRSEPFELLLLDLGLPGRDGLALLRAERERGLTLPVLIITARDAVSDRVQGLDAGADDYLIKPFELTGARRAHPRAAAAALRAPGPGHRAPRGGCSTRPPTG